MKIKKLICLIMIIITVLGCSGCGCVNIKPKTFEDKCKTSADGFVYYVDRSIGLCIIELPKTEEIVIPEYIDGIRVAQLGYEEIGIMYSETHVVDGSHVKKLTIQHPMVYYSVDFENVENLILFASLFVDNFKRAGFFDNGNFVKIGYSLFDEKTNRIIFKKIKNVEIHKDTTNQNIIHDEEIFLWEEIKYIEKGAFDKLTNVTFITSYNEKPSGWEEGWNGNNPVIWNSKI